MRERSNQRQPNDLLRQERLLRGWSQQQVANHVGTDDYTVGRWERGRARPGPYFRQKLCSLFGKDAQALGLLRERKQPAAAPDGKEPGEQEIFPSSSRLAGPSFWSVPFPRNPFFTGQEQFLPHLHRLLCPPPGAAFPLPSYALIGLAGSGKTQTAVEYAYRYAHCYWAIFWMSAETPERISASFRRLAQLVGLPESQQSKQARIVAAVQRWLQTQQDWLLIWDNVEDVHLLAQFLPPTHRGATLLTTRCRALGTLAQGLELPPLTQQEALLFVLRRAGLLPPAASPQDLLAWKQAVPETYAYAQEVVELMGRLPLALDQVSAYLVETPASLPEYLQLYQSRRAALLSRRGEGVTSHPQAVSTTWSLAFDQLEHSHAAAAELLRLCAFLHADAIPEEVLSAGAPFLGERLGPVVADPLLLHEAVRTLYGYSLLSRHVQEQTLSIHRLVQTVIRERMSEPERALWQGRVIRLLAALFPEVSYEVWGQCERLLPHVLLCARTIPDQVWNQEGMQVLCKAADYLRERAQYPEAEPLYQRALRLCQQILGPDCPEEARPLSGLALLSAEQGKHEQAEALYQQALFIREQSLGQEHPEVARLLNTLANLYLMQGKYGQAEPLYQRALFIQEQNLGSAHPEVARPLHNLALLYAKQGQYEQAESLYQQALAIDEQAYGPQHPDVAYPLYNLAKLYAEQGKQDQAEPLYRRALSIWEQSLGSAHPQVAYPLAGLADLSREQGQYEQAEAFYQRSLRIREQTLGEAHPEVAGSLNGLATLYCEQGREQEAERLYRRAQAIGEQHLGKLHPETANSLAHLARLSQKRGNDEQALSLLQRACSILEHTLGQAHPQTSKAMSDYHKMQQQRKGALEASRWPIKHEQ
jgi:tetratricopeptide (TPR) repeat protein/transcriptional regulator with XRE-family HTH domain